MKIGTRLTLRYTGFTAAVFLLLVAAIYLFRSGTGAMNSSVT